MDRCCNRSPSRMDTSIYNGNNMGHNNNHKLKSFYQVIFEQAKSVKAFEEIVDNGPHRIDYGMAHDIMNHIR